MSEPPSRRAEGSSFWASLRQFLQHRSASSLRETIEEAIEEHGAGRDDPDDLDAAEREMMRNMLRLSDRTAGDVAVPRAEIVALPDDADFASLVRLFEEAGHSRLPLYRESLDQVVGMIHVKDIYAVLAARFRNDEERPWPEPAALMRGVLHVPKATPVADLLTEMQRQRTHMAIVVDEYGGTHGLVTIEDVVEEIVGDIEDEHDEEEPPLLQPLASGGYIADARLPLDELEEATGLTFGDVDVDTLGGLAVTLAERVPEAGACLAHPSGWTIRVLASDGRRVERLRLEPPEPVEAGEGGR